MWKQAYWTKHEAQSSVTFSQVHNKHYLIFVLSYNQVTLQYNESFLEYIPKNYVVTPLILNTLATDLQ